MTWRRFQYCGQKGGTGIGYSGHKHQKGEKTIAIADNNGYVISPLIIAPVNRHDTVFLPDSLNAVGRLSRELGLDVSGSVLNLDAGFDSKANRKCVWNHALQPNIKENPRNRKKIKRGRKRFFDEEIYALRFTIERTFAWEDKFRRLIVRFETVQVLHTGFKLLAYSLINLRDFCTA